MSSNVQIGMEDETAIDIQLAEEQLVMAKKRALWYSVRRLAAPLVKLLDEVGADCRLSGELDIHATGDAAKLKQIIDACAMCGWTFECQKPAKGDTTWYAYGDHKDTKVRVWLVFTSSVCKRIKVGTKMVEQDVYDVACDPIFDEALPPPMIDHDII